MTASSKIIPANSRETYPKIKFDTFCRAGVILDGWMYPLKSEYDLKINKPMLFINSQTFHIYANIQLMKAYSDLPNSQLYTIR